MAATCSLLLAAGYLLSWPLAKGFTSHVADKVGNPLTLGRGILIAQQGSPTDPSQKLSCVFPADIMNKLDLTFQYNTDFKNGSCFMDLTPLPPGGDVFGYTFRLTFWYPDHTWYQLNWLQESDPTARRIIGYKPLDSYTAQAEFFKGLGVTPFALSSGKQPLKANQLDLCLMDSSPSTGYQWNCAGSTMPYPPGCDIASENCGIAGVQDKGEPLAFAMTLEYISPATACCFSFQLSATYDPVDLKTNLEPWASCVKDLTIHSNYTGWSHDRCPNDAAEARRWWFGMRGESKQAFGVSTLPLTVMVINGEDAPACTFKSMASIGTLIDGVYTTRSSQCGGTILNEMAILTAAHCFTGNPDDDPENVLVGRTTLSDSGGQVLKIRKVESSKQYDPHADPLHDDWAVVFTEGTIQMNDCVQPVQRAELQSPPSKDCIVTGWGVSCLGPKEVEKTNKLQQGVIPLLSTCPQDAPAQGALCADTSLVKQDAGKGDSGGPLWCKVGDTLQQFGLVSFGPTDNPCTQRASGTGVYTNVAFFKDFIDKVINV